ncbi:MAG: hypothetical protein J6Q15_03300, partial [Clostridia bacterium]|nr:hypothetical protein [Clostridia bacterium]
SNSIIISCYVANTSIENTSTHSVNIVNRTAGFVATNNGLIAYSYVKGLERSIITTRARATGAKIYASGSGSVAGFTFINNGEIHDCYSNIICESSASAVAGFVYDTTVGIMAQCYSASTVVVSDKKEDPLATEMPFVGVSIEKQDAQKLLSNDKMVNCYYLDDGVSYDTYLPSADRSEPKGIGLLSFSNSNNLNNYSFINQGLIEQELNGVWTYSTACDSNRSTYGLGYTSLPELTSANTISRSLRVYSEEQNNSGLHNYKYPSGYEQGSKNNPYAISNLDEYKSVFINSAPITNNGVRYKTGYVRFVDNISFMVDKEYVNIDTRSNYILGDKYNNTFTLIDGNGMTISDVIINYANDDQGNLGLFSEVYYSVIKGLNINYASQSNNDGSEVGSATVTYAGGIAGIAKDTYLIDINLMGDITLRAHNVVGGVVGKLTGTNSGLYNITSELNVQAGNYSNSNRYINEQSEPAYLSYAGGIAGIIDVGGGKIDSTTYNMSKLTVNSANVRANRAGGIAGYMGPNVNAKRLTYYIDGNSQVFGREVAGGIVADNFADIQLSQANRDIENQYNYDKAFAKYINDDNLIGLNNNASTYGNLSAVTGQKIVGGFIGVNYAGKITNSLTKANIGHNDDYGLADVVGGFIGKTYGGDLQYVYAQNFIELIYETESVDGNPIKYNTKTVGGLVGRVENEVTDNINLGNKSLNVGIDNVVVATWFDELQVEEYSKLSDVLVDYIAGYIDNSVAICKTSEDVTSRPIINYGVFNADSTDVSMYDGGLIKNGNTGNEHHFKTAEYYSMNDLYSISSGDDEASSLQRDIFNELFIVWPLTVWELDADKFMPNLKDDNATDYIKIETKDDIAKLEQFPDRNFILVKDVDVGEYSNYVVNIEFKGSLIGTLKEDGSFTKFYNITLNAHTENDSGSGFFKHTTGARIANINFEYNYISLAGGAYDRVGGVSANDSNSRFEQINVTSSSEYAISTASGANIRGAVGSIVGASERSKVISCYSNLKFNLTAQNNANIGGLVGNINGEENNDGEIVWDGLISSSTYAGEIVVASSGANIAGIVANARYTHIGDARVVAYEIDNATGQIVSVNPVKISTSGNATNRIGGVVAYMDMSSISDSSTEIEILYRDYGAIENNTYYIGGIAGDIVNASPMERDIENSYSRIAFKMSNINNAYVGGVVGKISSNAGIKLDKVVSDITVEYMSGTYIENMVLGGIVALTTGKTSDGDALYGLMVNNSMSIMHCNAEYSTSLIGGGIIGQATGSYSINNTVSMGQLFANNSLGTQLANNKQTTLTVLGGLVGLADEVAGCLLQNTAITQNINNSYTVLTISTAGVYKGTVIEDATTSYSHDVYANAIVGYTYEANKISGNGILYSSDYTLVFEKDDAQKDKFVNTPINVTASVLINNEQTLKPVAENMVDAPSSVNYIGGGWRWDNGGLPVPTAITNLLVNINVLEYQPASTEANFVGMGQPYSPIILNNSDFNNRIGNFDSGYLYYMLAEEITTFGNLGDLNGVLLGNNQIIRSNDLLFNTIMLHSAVSNITLMDCGMIANVNNGTIFMSGVQYEDMLVSDRFGGVVSYNFGIISNCYNMGNATQVAGDVGGIAYVNHENASIEDSYFTGSFAGGAKGSALVHSNSGYIANGYSAGMAKSFIGNLDESLSIA